MSVSEKLPHSLQNFIFCFASKIEFAKFFADSRCKGRAFEPEIPEELKQEESDMKITKKLVKTKNNKKIKKVKEEVI